MSVKDDSQISAPGEVPCACKLGSVNEGRGTMRYYFEPAKKIPVICEPEV
jgi:hypothetical protein